MTKYQAPKHRLHREFLYLDHETVVNSLSAFEAGAVDEIIHKVSEAREGGLEGSLAAGPAKLAGGRKKTASVEEELVLTRTRFSSFESWLQKLQKEQALGQFDQWDADVRNELRVGDTLTFQADLRLSPMHLIIRTFLSFAESAGRPDHPFHQKGQQLAETKKNARMMLEWTGGRDGNPNSLLYAEPHGVTEPKIVMGVQERFLLRGSDAIEGEFTVVGQVANLLEGNDRLSAIRIVRNVPPTQLETEKINEGMSHFIEPARALGIELSDADITISSPAVVVQPIAIYR